MKNALAEKGRFLAKKVLLWQALIGVFCSLLCAFMLDLSTAQSALYGVVISVLPSLLFARLAFRYAGASQSDLVVRSFSQGSKLKLLLTIFLFVVAFKGLNAQPIPLFVTFAITTATQWVAMLLYRHQS